MDLSISIVNTNNNKLLKHCLYSIEKNELTRYSYEIFVVDNCSTDHSVEMIKNYFPNVNLIKNNVCLGFSSNHNKIVRESKGRYILILNEDTIINKNTLNNMILFMDQNPNIGISGCKVFLGNGTIQKTCGNFPTFLGELHRLTIGATIKSIIAKKYYDWRQLKKFDYNSVREVDWLSGVFMLIRSDLIKKVGLLDENFFLYYEDTEFCYRVRQNSNYKIVYYPNCYIKHFHGQTVGKTKYLGLVYNIKSCAYYFSKTKGKSWGKFVWYFSLSYYRLLRYILIIFNIFTFGSIKRFKMFEEKITSINKMLSL